MFFFLAESSPVCESISLSALDQCCITIEILNVRTCEFDHFSKFDKIL